MGEVVRLDNSPLTAQEVLDFMQAREDAGEIAYLALVYQDGSGVFRVMDTAWDAGLRLSAGQLLTNAGALTLHTSGAHPEA